MRKTKTPAGGVLENVARSIGSTLGKVVRTATDVAEELPRLAKKVRPGKARKKAGKKRTVAALKPRRKSARGSVRKSSGKTATKRRKA